MAFRPVNDIVRGIPPSPAFGVNQRLGDGLPAPEALPATEQAPGAQTPTAPGKAVDPSQTGVGANVADPRFAS